MATIKFTSLHCIRQQDVTGSDEPHLFIDGVDTWNGVVKKGGNAPLNISRSFDGSMNVMLTGEEPEQLEDDRHGHHRDR